LHAVVGFLDLLSGAQLERAHQGWVEGAQLSAQHLLSLIDDLLDVSKLEAGQVELAREEFELERVLTDCIAMTRTRVRPWVELRQSLSATTTKLIGDSRRVRQILLNLLNNAAKFTEHGHIELRAEAHPGPDDQARVTIHVEDTGVGVPEASVDEIFLPFRQAHGARSGGTGLGLFLCRALARMMGGDVTIESTTRGGSCFRVDLALDVPRSVTDPPKLSAAPPRTGARADFAGVRVLMADDVRMNLLVTQEIMRVHFGAELDTAADGLEAVAMAQARTYDLVLMDLQMPFMDGASAARRIRTLGIGVPIVAMTASAVKDEIQQALAAGMNGLLTKPVRPAELERVLRAHTRRRERRPPSPPAARSRSSSPGACQAAAHAHFAAMVGEERAAELVEAAAQSLAEGIDALRAVRGVGGAGAIRRALHKLKGALLNCGLSELAGEAAALETSCGAKNGPDWILSCDAMEAKIAAFVDGCRGRAAPTLAPPEP
jgi:CheY-like chemotaxis protein/HPt (histidine-containing phosphotransfer) domain-containing protein/anti-sigma regulatory factor (Ser/Thr protein kinase)